MTLVESSPKNAQENLCLARQPEKLRIDKTSGSKIKRARGTSGPEPANGDNSLRHKSLSARQTSVSSDTSNTPESMNPFCVPNSTSNGSRGQHPSSAGNTVGKTTQLVRKPIAPSVISSETKKPLSKTRPRSIVVSQVPKETGNIVARNHNENVGNTRSFTAARSARAKSIQPSSRSAPGRHVAEHFDHQTISEMGDTLAHTHERGAVSLSTSRKRMSVVPGMPSPSHPTGLGARTVSPTDARRAKRMSNMQAPTAVPQTPTPKSDSIAHRGSTQSPTLNQAKTITPSSLEASSDATRKPQDSRLSPVPMSGSNYNREPMISSPSQSSLQMCSSRLFASKPRNNHNSTGNERTDTEFVPPVPAIPKAFESPKDSPANYASFTNRKSTVSLDPNQINGISTNSLSEKVTQREQTQNLKESRPRTTEIPETHSNTYLKSSYVKKTLQPLRLPPFNLRPLSTTTANKVEASEERSSIKDATSDLISFESPMTASKASFFANKSDSGNPAMTPSYPRSNSATHYLRPASNLNNSTSSRPMTTNRDSRNKSFPPVSSSMPHRKATTAYGCIPRTKMNDEVNSSERSGERQRFSIVHRPRTLNLNLRASVGETSPGQPSSSEEPSTPLSATSLRRKLSLGWRRSTSKSSISFSHAATEHDTGNLPPIKKADNSYSFYPLTSSTLNNLSNDNLPSPNLSIKSATHLDFKRRKSSASSLSMLSNYHDRKISDSWGTHNGAGNISRLNHDRSIPTARTSSMMHRVMNSNDLPGSARRTPHWSLDLDKHDLVAESEMKKLASKRKETEQAARMLDALTKRAVARERMSPRKAILEANLNTFERGEIVDYKDVYFCGTADALKHVGEISTDSVNFGYDDERGDYSIIRGDHLSYRYEIIDLLGKGSFGQVVRCVDHKTGGLVAVKIIRNKKRFHQQALVEVNILKKLREWDPEGKHDMVKFTQSFYFRGHLCISAELLDINLYEFIKINSFRGFSLKIVRRFTKQILNSLLLLQQHKVIHCDLKPENILLVHPLRTEIKVIDFGSSCFENEKVYTYIQSRFYRSPEVILGMTYGMPIDMWSLGCIMAELYSGVPIFPGENEQEQLACIMEVFGPPEKHLIEKSTRRKLFFDSLGKPRLTVSSKGRRRRPFSKTLQQVLKCNDESFLDFLSKCLRWDPERRMKPNDAIRHDFIKYQKALPPLGSARHTSSIRNESPVRRSSTIKSTLGNRPLPEPPLASSLSSHKIDITAKNNETITSKGSPAKTSVITGSSHRRQSIFNGKASPQPSKRLAQGGKNVTVSNSSALPRVTKLTSGRNEATNINSTIFPRNSSLAAISTGSSNGIFGPRRIQ